MTPIPLTPVGGFLGAGKTTLVNHLLATADRRFGVLVNDFGAIAIDAALIAAHDGGVVSLTNGCVCCETGGDLGAGLAQLATRDPPIDHAIVEASGVGDPWRIAQLALVEPGFSLDPIVVVADALNLERQLAGRWVADTVRGQLLAAEIVVLNKIDLAPDPAGARAALASLCPMAPVVETRNAAVAIGRLSFPVSPRPRFRANPASAHAFPVWHYLPARPFDRARLRAVLAALPRSILRVKGFCRLDGDPAASLLQFAAGQWALSLYGEAPPGLVVIGTPEMPAPPDLVARFDFALLEQ